MNCVNSERFPTDKGAFFGSGVELSDRTGPLFTASRTAGGFYLLTSSRPSVSPFWCFHQGQRTSCFQKATCAIKELSSRFLFESELGKSSYLSSACDSLPAFRPTSKGTIFFFFFKAGPCRHFQEPRSQFIHPSSSGGAS